MLTITKTHATTTAAPSSVFARWADMETWPQWNTDTEWVRLEGPFEQGATGRLKPKGGPAVRFTIERLVPGREFVDVSRLLGARLTFSHTVAELEQGCEVDVTVTISGPLRLLWRAILGTGIRASAQGDLDRLMAAAEADEAAADAPAR